jgi:hypothetical protein
MSYGKQGTNKSGVQAEHHAIIHTSQHPVWLPGEKDKKPPMTMKPIRVSVKDNQHKLDERSRLNYAKLYTVEYNVKVWFIGRISKECEAQLALDYNTIHPPIRSPNERSNAASTDHAVGFARGGAASPGYTANYSQFLPPSSSGLTQGYTAPTADYYKAPAAYPSIAATQYAPHPNSSTNQGYSSAQSSYYQAASMYPSTSTMQYEPVQASHHMAAHDPQQPGYPSEVYQNTEYPPTTQSSYSSYPNYHHGHDSQNPYQGR